MRERSQLRHTEDGTTMTPQQDVEPMAAFVATVAAMAEAARSTSGGMRTVGRRAARSGAGLSRRAWANTLDSGRRANVAIRVYRGDERTYQRRPADYVAAGVFAGMTGAFVLVALGRAVLRRPGGDPGTARVRQSVDSARTMAARVRRRRSPPAAGSSDDAGPAEDAAGVTTLPTVTTIPTAARPSAIAKAGFPAAARDPR
jgi:hypothetical protein